MNAEEWQFGLENKRQARMEAKEQLSEEVEKQQCLQSALERRDLEEQERKRIRDETDKAMEALLNEPEEGGFLNRRVKSASLWLSKKQLLGKRNHQVWLHIYDLDAVIAKLNDYALRAMGLGAYHCAVEVLGNEWFFAWGDSSDFNSGVLFNEPKCHQIHVYKESINMGVSPLTEEEVKAVIRRQMEAWPANSYHIVRHNCVHFAEDLLQKLRVPQPFPTWVRGAPDAGNSSMLQPLADWGWNWMRGYYDSPPPSQAIDTQGQDEPSSLSCFARQACCAEPRKSRVLVEKVPADTTSGSTSFGPRA